jgi:hypothetical protein
MIVKIKDQNSNNGWVNWAGEPETVLRFYVSHLASIEGPDISEGAGQATFEVEDELVPWGVATTRASSPLSARQIEQVKAEYLAQKLEVVLPVAILFGDVPVEKILSMKFLDWDAITEERQMLALRLLSSLGVKEGGYVDTLCRMINSR